MKKPCGEFLFSDLSFSSSGLLDELNFSWNFVDPIFIHPGNWNFLTFFVFFSNSIFYGNLSMWVVLICWVLFRILMEQ